MTISKSHQKFEAESVRYGVSIESGDSATANASVKRAEQLAEEILGREDGADVLAESLRSPQVYIRYMAAAILVSRPEREHSDAARDVLKALAQGPGIVALSATISLDVAGRDDQP